MKQNAFYYRNNKKFHGFDTPRESNAFEKKKIFKSQLILCHSYSFIYFSHLFQDKCVIFDIVEKIKLPVTFNVRIPVSQKTNEVNIVNGVTIKIILILFFLRKSILKRYKC